LLASAAGGALLGGATNPLRVMNRSAFWRYVGIGSAVNAMIGAVHTAADPNANYGDFIRSVITSAMAGGAFTATSLVTGAGVRWFMPKANPTAILYTSNTIGGAVGGIASNELSNLLQGSSLGTNLKNAAFWGAIGGLIQSAMTQATAATPEEEARMRVARRQQDIAEGSSRGRRIMNDYVEQARSAWGEFFGDLVSDFYGTFLPYH
jgi:hypothetical protein